MKHTRKQIYEAIKYWKNKLDKMVNEEVISTEDQYYVDVTNANNSLTIKEFKEAFVNLPPNGFKNPILNVGPGGKILGHVNSITLDEFEGHKFVALTISPYRTRHVDFSIPKNQGHPLTLNNAIQIMSSMPDRLAVLIKSKNFYGSPIHSNDIILTHVARIQMSESDGFFIRPDTWYHTIEDMSKKNMDLVMQMKHRS